MTINIQQQTGTTGTPGATSSTGTTTPNTDSGFAPIPTRLHDLPPLVVGQEGQTNEVDPEIRQAVVATLGELEAKLATVHRTAAESYISQDMHEQAVNHLQTAVTFAPNNLEYRNQLGVTLYMTGDDAGAIAAFQTVLQSENNNGDAWFNLGMVLFGSQDLANAEECFKNVTILQPDNAEAFNNYGVTAFQQGKQDIARQAFERALQIDPANEDAKVNLAAF